MNISKHILAGACVALGLASCANEDFSTVKTGSMSLSVDKVAPTATRAIETADFPVAVYSLLGSEVVSYEKASLIPEKQVMAVGEYYATAHTPGVMEKIQSTPYYAGRDTFEIMQNINTIATVVCRMANGSVTVAYSDAFLDAFSDWTVSIDDGGQTALVYSKERDGLTPAPAYIRWEENVKTLKVNIVATTMAGNRISTSNTLTKLQASEKYDSDTEYFAGGDCIVINFDPVENTEGDITGIVVRANISFDANEREESFEMEVEDFIPEDTGDDTPGGDTPGGDSDAIKLDLPEDMTITLATDPSLGDTYIAAEHGIESIKVKVESTSADMMSELDRLISDYGVDFVNGAEVVENQDMVTLFLDLEQVLEVPTKGDTEYTFPIGNFFSFLGILPGEHTFKMVVTDMEGNTKNGQLTLTVEE